jgi:hypothetical protein
MVRYARASLSGWPMACPWKIGQSKRRIRKSDFKENLGEPIVKDRHDIGCLHNLRNNDFFSKKQLFVIPHYSETNTLPNLKKRTKRLSAL